MDSNRALSFVFGTLGGVIGGVLGYWVFSLLVGQGLYAIAMPGALIGLGCGLASRIRSIALGLVSAVLALALGLFLEWQYFPFRADDSLVYFLTHLGDLKPASLIMIALGGVFGYWFGVGRERHTTIPPTRSPLSL